MLWGGGVKDENSGEVLNTSEAIGNFHRIMVKKKKKTYFQKSK